MINIRLLLRFRYLVSNIRVKRRQMKIIFGNDESYTKMLDATPNARAVRPVRYSVQNIFLKSNKYTCLLKRISYHTSDNQQTTGKAIFYT